MWYNRAMVERNLTRYIDKGMQWQPLPETLHDTEPFLIRGHRLQNLWQASRHSQVDPIVRAKKCADELIEAIQKHGSPTYQVDMLDFDGIEAPSVQEKTQRYFELFFTLPDDYPVDIVGALPDIYCKTVPAKGMHCRVESNMLYGCILDRVSAEQKFVNRFVTYLYTSGQQPSSEIVSYMFKDTRIERKLKKYRTDMGTVRRYLSTKSVDEI